MTLVSQATFLGVGSSRQRYLTALIGVALATVFSPVLALVGLVIGSVSGLVNYKVLFDVNLQLMGGRLPFLPHKLQQFMLSAIWPDARNIMQGCDIFSWEPPLLCPTAGNRSQELWSAEDLKKKLPDFADAFSRRPIKYNTWGMNTNHAFALWFTVKALQLTHVVESGVLRGSSTWLIRDAAGPKVQIYSIDPLPEEFLSWKDSGLTKYMMGNNFTDVGHTDWSSKIPEGQRATTLVVLDDHTSAITRLKQLQRMGFVHVWFDDNSKKGADFYTMSSICTPLAEGVENVAYQENLFSNATRISVQEHEENLEYVRKNVESYFEFPAVFDGCGWGKRALVSDQMALTSLGLPSFDEDVYHYKHMHPPYVKLRQ